MKITEVLNKAKPTLSFEFFPPKTPEQEEELLAVIGQLKTFKPDFVSVTYGAMGANREKAFFWANEIKSKYGLEPVAHLTCVNASKDDIAARLDELEKIGVENILPLRGDPPAGTDGLRLTADGFKHASELIAFIKQRQPNFCLGAAGYPEKHPESPSFAKDLDYLKMKVEAGAEFIITQLFFDNRLFSSFVQSCLRAGITTPILPGLMPITSLHQIKRFTGICGATIPPELMAKLEKHQADPQAIKQIGTEFTIAQARGLLKSGVKGLHFFVMNQAEPISTVLSELGF
ncbi:MAG: methylenetetrahydrofolate reductase [NAD(P)H] [Candidatus Margulisiibacteriota bacterium]